MVMPQGKTLDPMVVPILLRAASDAGDISSARELLGEMNEQAEPKVWLFRKPFRICAGSLWRFSRLQESSALASVLAGFQRLLDPKGTVLALAGRRIDAPVRTNLGFLRETKPW